MAKKELENDVLAVDNTAVATDVAIGGAVASGAIELVDKIEFTGEVFMRERVDEDTKEIKYSVAIAMNNPFVELFEGGSGNEYNHKIGLAFKATQGKVKAQFNYRAKELLRVQDKIEFVGFVQRKQFFDRQNYKRVRYIAIFIKSPFDDGVISLTIPRAETLGLFEMFADERLVKQS